MLRVATVFMAMVLGLASGVAAAQQPGRIYRVGYTQIVDHPALNATRQGFLDGLNAAGFVVGTNLVFEYQNAQGDVGNARNIADKFLADKVDLIAPCTTPSAQAAVRVARGVAVPVVFGCVTNPVEAGIVASLDKPSGSNVTGTYGFPPVARMFDVIRQVRPDTKRIGTIYNAGESNSATFARLSKAEAERRGLTWVEIAISGSAEVKTAAESLVGRVDVLLTGQDNTLASAFDAVVKTARDAKLPLFSFDATAVEHGAIASFGQNQYQTGVDWAKELAVPVLLGRNAGDIVPVPYHAYDLQLNTAAAGAMGITLPPDLVKAAATVFDR
jgi:putative tryptophan/tyrosine transport system substrate-binding protein